MNMNGKKLWCLVVPVMLAIGVHTAHAQQVSLDIAVQRSAEGLSTGVTLDARVAVIAVQAGTGRMSDFLINELISSFVGMQARHRFTVVDRAQLDLLVGEMELGSTGLVDDATAQHVGRFMGVQYIVTGTFESLAGFYRFRTQLLEVETAVIRVVHTADVQADSLVQYLMATAVVAPVVTPTHMPVPAHPVMPAIMPGARFDHFSSGERWGTFALNWLLPGVGSLAIMGDTSGGVFQLLCGGIGMIVFMSAILGAEQNEYGEVEVNQGQMTLGALMVTTSFIFNIVRSNTFRRSHPHPRVRTASIINPDAWDIAVTPGRGGIEKVSLTHTLRF
jgi:TolB-like protein